MPRANARQPACDRRCSCRWSTRETGRAPVRHAHDAPVGRYVHVPIDGHDYRLYYEEAGEGIPLLLQHTAGAQPARHRVTAVEIRRRTARRLP